MELGVGHKKITWTTALTLIALLFHVVGFVGIAVTHTNEIISAVPWHILLMFILILLSFAAQRNYLLKWLPVAYLTGFGVEWAGVNKGWLFGSYKYTDVLGVSWQHIPMLTGCMWVVVVSGSICLLRLIPVKLPLLLICACAATIATLYDWLIEPVANTLNYWHWTTGAVPLWNYACWWMVSFLLALLWQVLRVKANQFAINLFTIQVVFFALLRMIL